MKLTINGDELDRICAVDEGKHLIILELDGTEVAHTINRLAHPASRS
jgi:hypothetical protein